MKRSGLFGCRPFKVFVGAASFVMAATLVQAQVAPPTFSKTFNPDTIGPGSMASLRFSISNPAATPATDLAFTDDLPAGVAIAAPANAATDCGGVVTAPAGGGSITFSGGSLGGGGASCSVSVDVTSSTPGTHMNISGDLTSSAGSSGTAADDLTVVTTLPGFRKSFAPNSVPLGGRSTLTFTIDNSVNASSVQDLDFTDVLPPGMVIAGPANASTTCGTAALPATLVATPGTGVITLDSNGTFGFPALSNGASCTVAVDVVAGAVGSLNNVSGDLLASFVASGRASAVLDVTASQLALIKSFTDDPVIPGGTVTLEFTIADFDRGDAATNITFTDDLDATLNGLTAVGLPLSDVCGAGSVLTGTTLLTLTGGNLPPEGFCTFSVDLQVPGGAATGSYPNTTSSISADFGGSGVVGSPATDILFVAPAPTLSKDFTDDPVGAGDTVTLEFTIDNTSTAFPATDIAFTDELTTFLPSPVSVSLPTNPCGAGSSLALANLGIDQQQLVLADGSLAPAGAAGDSCTFSVTIDIPNDLASGAYTNLTGPITATVDSVKVVGMPATADLVVAGAPRLTKEFTDDPVAPGGTVTLEFTLFHDESATGDAVGINFTDDLNGALSGLTAIELPADGFCGAGSQISGTTNLSFTDGSLAPGASCAFTVTLQVPAGAAPGFHANSTSNVGATVAGVSVTGNPGTDDLLVSPLSFTKEFTDDPVLPGGTATLEFTIDNSNGAQDVTGIGFTDSLTSVLSGLVVSGALPSSPCGPGSSLTGTNQLLFTGGNLTAGTSCTFSVTVLVPPGAAADAYGNITSGLNATIGGSPVVLPPAVDSLVVTSDGLTLSKSFTDDPVFPGDTVTLQFTITNLDAAQVATGISFTDDLDAALSGLTAIVLPASGFCGAGSQISGTSLLTLTGGSLGPGASCTFDMTLQVPASVPIGGPITNTTSQAAATIGGLPATGDPASDDLLINHFVFDKRFSDTATAGGTTTLTFTIENPSTTAAVSGVGFLDDLDAVLPGLMAEGLTIDNVCGAGSSISGSSVISLRDGVLGPGEICTFEVTLRVPANAVAGDYVNTTTPLTAGGVPAGEPASAGITVVAGADAAAIPATNPLGTLILLTVLAAIGFWQLRVRV